MDLTKRLNNFNLIRLLAAMQVLLVHAFNHFEIHNVYIDVFKLFPGVPVFFFISGLLIGGTYIRNQQKGNFVFFWNRCLRLYPALLLCVFLSIMTVYLVGYYKTVNFSIVHFVSWVFGQITFFQFYNPDFMRQYGIGVLNGSLWTISVELQFYLLTPLFYHLFKIKKGKLFLTILFVLSILINVYLKIYLDWSKMYMKLISVSFLPWVYMFLIGFLVSKYKEGIKKYTDNVNIFLVFVLYVFSMFLIGSYKNNAMNSINPISVFLLCLFIYKFSNLNLTLPDFIIKYINNNDISYGIYIYHMPIINTLLFTHIFTIKINIFLTILITILFSIFSWNFVESPILKFKK